MGFLVALEGIDGAGKGTQAAALVQQLQLRGLKTALVSFPRYAETAFGRKVGDFLNGKFGSLQQVDPFLASLLYAGDRFESQAALQGLLATCEVVVCDRFVASNIAHQGAKRTGSEREALVADILQVEHGVFGTPRPDLTVWLSLPVSEAQKLIARKAARQYTDKAADLQEADAQYLQAVHEVYQTLATSESNWVTVKSCDEAGQLRDVTDISEQVVQIVARRHQLHRELMGSEESNSAATAVVPTTYAELVQSRRTWLSHELEGWCRRATVAELQLAEVEWPDLAGRINPDVTLWRWAWSRFPGLVHAELGLDESRLVSLQLKDGRCFVGYPNSRRSQKNLLTIYGQADEQQPWEDHGPFSLDEIHSLRIKNEA